MRAREGLKAAVARGPFRLPRGLFNATAVILLLAAGSGAARAEGGPCDGPVRAEAPLAADDTLRTGEGVTFLAGAILAGPCAEGFGGFSAMVVDPDLRITAVSDRGNWLRARLSLEDGAIALTDATLSPVAGSEAEGPRGRCEGLEAEGLVRADDVLLMSFDSSGIVLAFDPETLERRPDRDRPPLPLLRPGAQEGYEAIAALPDGRLIALRERETMRLPTRANNFRPPAQRVWTLRPGQRWVERQVYRGPLQPRDANEFRVADATNLPDGGLLLLETSWMRGKGNHARVLRASFAGDTLSASLPPLLAVAPGPLSDNFEAIATVRSEAAGTLLLLLTDDNLSRRCVPNRGQRTKLLVFRLGE